MCPKYAVLLCVFLLRIITMKILLIQRQIKTFNATLTMVVGSIRKSFSLLLPIQDINVLCGNITRLGDTKGALAKGRTLPNWRFGHQLTIPTTRCNIEPDRIHKAYTLHVCFPSEISRNWDSMTAIGHSFRHSLWYSKMTSQQGSGKKFNNITTYTRP